MPERFASQVLTGQHVRLEPLEARHFPLLLVALEPDIFTYMNPDPLRDPEILKKGVLPESLNPSRRPFVTFDIADGELAGSSSLYLVRPESRTFEIGGTWVKKVYQGTQVNTEAKYLMLRYAFEVWQAIRVQIRTHDKNERSKRATEKLGLVKEGVIRNESIFRDGRYRDTAIYSVIRAEWPEVKARLEEKIALSEYIK